MCMKEALERRLKYCIGEYEKNPFGKAPDLILMDGGITQVRIAKEVLFNLNLNIPVYGLVKNDKHRTRGIIDSDGNEFVIKDNEIINFVTFIQDEVHKTAIEYHRKLREKKTSKSILDEIEGIGEKRKAALLKHFKSIRKIANASIDELLDVEGIDEKIANAIFNAFH